MGTTRRGRCQGDKGAILVLVAAGMVLLFVLVAFVVDLGQARFSKRDSQQAVDLASLAAGFYLAGNGSDPVVSNPRKACGGAIDSVRTNVEDFAGLTDAAITAACAGYPNTATGCSSYSDVVMTEGRYTLTVHYPVLDSELTDARFAGAGVADGSNKCERMQIALVKTDDTGFASIIGVDEVVTNASSIVRGKTLPPVVPPAFLILERTDCGALSNSVNGAGNEGIVVENNGNDPGIIHSDSNATTNCSGNTKDAYAIYGAKLSSGGPSINAKNGAGGASGIISTAATNGKGAADFEGGGLSVSPTIGDVYSRKIVDKKYNSGSSTAITNLHLAASAAVRATGVPDGADTSDCDGNVSPAAPPSTQLYVDCPSFNAGVSFAGYTSVVFRNDIALKQSNVVLFPDAKTIVVRGQVTAQSGQFVAPAVQRMYVGGGVNISSGAGLAINSTTPSSCSGREGPTWQNTTAFAIFGSTTVEGQARGFASSGNVSLCQTTMYLGGPKSSANSEYSIQQTEEGGTCSTDLPCPKKVDNAATGTQVFFGSGTTHWSAPNQFTTPVPSNTPQGLEDLALWTEGFGTSDIKSGATVHSSGTFFGPSSEFNISSPANSLPRDAQFIARRLLMTQGTLRMQPTAANSVLIPIVGSYSLIR